MPWEGTREGPASSEGVWDMLSQHFLKEDTFKLKSYEEKGRAFRAEGTARVRVEKEGRLAL